MKTASFLPALIALCALLCFPASVVAQVTPAQPEPAPPPFAAVDPFPEMTAALAAATPENREGLSAVQQRMDRAIDDQITAWKAAGYKVSLAADEKLDTATEDFAEKLRLLTLASPEVWESSKHDTELSFRMVQTAYTAIMNNPARK